VARLSPLRPRNVEAAAVAWERTVPWGFPVACRQEIAPTKPAGMGSGQTGSAGGPVKPATILRMPRTTR
jgi:hypothetical protein